MSNCNELGLKAATNGQVKTVLHGIGGKRVPIGTARILIPLAELRVIEDVQFLIPADNVPSLLSVRDMIFNNLDMTIQNLRTSFRG